MLKQVCIVVLSIFILLAFAVAAFDAGLWTTASRTGVNTTLYDENLHPNDMGQNRMPETIKSFMTSANNTAFGYNAMRSATPTDVTPLKVKP